VVFTPRAAGRPIARSRVRLDKKTRLLYRGRRFFINGESIVVKTTSARMLRELPTAARPRARGFAAGLAV
jgi:hypothetical protein